MSEIEKMYKLANIQPQYKKRIECKEGYSIGQPCGKSPCINCNKSIFEDVMPPFTAEKQIELIKFLMGDYSSYLNIIDNNNFENSLASYINCLWLGLSEEEKQHIKEILEDE